MPEAIEKETIKQTLKPPVMWNVIFINDEYTTFEFVMDCLKYVFGKSEQDAERITMEVHKNKRGVAGQYTQDIALTKQMMVMEYARQEEHPLKVEVEPA